MAGMEGNVGEVGRRGEFVEQRITKFFMSEGSILISEFGEEVASLVIVNVGNEGEQCSVNVRTALFRNTRFTDAFGEQKAFGRPLTVWNHHSQKQSCCCHDCLLLFTEPKSPRRVPDELAAARCRIEGLRKSRD